MFLDGLDTIDQQILQLLIQNARASYSDIGQRIGISRVAVKSRIQALEQKGIIEEYTTIVNPQKISGAMSCYFEIETSPESLGQVTRILEQNELRLQCDTFTGQRHQRPETVKPKSACPAPKTRQTRRFLLLSPAAENPHYIKSNILICPSLQDSCFASLITSPSCPYPIKKGEFSSWQAILRRTVFRS